MYEEFYQLDSRPFTASPDPRFIYWTEGHLLAYTMLRYGVITNALITVVTGAIGAGKTTLLRQFMQEVPNDYRVGLISNLKGGRGELLQWVFMALDEPCGEDSYVNLFRRFQDLVVSTYANGKRVLLIIDEAQNLPVEMLEELRMLSNINTDGDELLQIILIGQPELRQTLARPDLVQFAQRISADFHLDTLSAEETENYIVHRLTIVGAKWRIFPSVTCSLIHQATKGVPRLINILCDLCLVYGFSAEKRVIDEALLREFINSAQKHNVYGQFTPLSDSPKLVREA